MIKALQNRRMTWQNSQILFLLMGVLTLIPFIWSVSRVQSHADMGLHVTNTLPVEKLDWLAFYTGARILNVTPNSPADLAGVQNGDELLQINDVAFQGSYQDASIPFSEAKADTLIINRNNQSLSITVVRPPFRFSFYLLKLEPILVGAIFWIASMACILLQPGKKLSIIFFAGCQAIFAILVSGALSSTEGPWARVIFDLAIILFPPFLIHFNLLFVGIPLKRMWRWLLKVVYVALLVQLGLFAFFTLIGTQVPVWGYFFRFFGGCQILALLIDIVLMLYPDKASSLAALRKRSILIKSATVVMVPGFLFAFLPDKLFGQPIVPYVWIEPLSVILPLGYVYLGATNGLAKVDRILSSIFLYVVFVGVLAGTFFLSFWAIDVLFQPSRQGYVIAATAIAILEIGALFFIYPLLRRSIDHLFYGSWYDYRSIVRSSSLEFCQIYHLEEWIAHLFATVRAMRFQSALLLWPEQDAFTIKGNFDHPTTVLDGFTLPSESRLIRYLTSFPDMLSRSQLTAWDREAAAELIAIPQEINLILPFMSHNKVQAILLLGEQQGGALVDTIDAEILVTVARYASIAAENIALLEDQRKRLAEMQRMRDELAETQHRLIGSREAERLRLAQDLHDGPIQDLYGARLHLNTLVIPQENMMQFAMIQGILYKIADTLRTICKELRPPALTPFGLEPAIRSHLEQLKKTYPDLQIETSLFSDGQLLSENIRLALFRVYQEAVMNILKHAQATCISVRFSLSEQHILLTISDNGNGFLKPAQWTTLTKQGHFGVASMIERIEAIGGTLTLKTQPMQGTVIDILMPR